MKTYKEHLTKFKKGDYFVFGSNTEGRHGKGAALVAHGLFGAKYGVSRGPQGESYAIVTKDLKAKSHPSVDPAEIEGQIYLLYEFAKQKPDSDFYVAYSGTGKNLNGYTPQEMADMFSSWPIPENIVFEEQFSKLLNIVI
jgi:hypothetical protein